MDMIALLPDGLQQASCHAEATDVGNGFSLKPLLLLLLLLHVLLEV
jgi:hypothetical protein